MKASSSRPTPSALSSLISNYASSIQPASSPSRDTTSTSQYAQHLNLDLPLDILHNLQYQHSWTDLRLHVISSGKIVDVSTSDTRPAASIGSTVSISTSLTHVRPRSPSPSVSPSSLHRRHATPSSASTEPIYQISGLPPRHAYIHPDFQSHLIRKGISASRVKIQREFVLPLSLTEKYSLKKLSYVFDSLPARKKMELKPAADEALVTASGTSIQSNSNGSRSEEITHGSRTTEETRNEGDPKDADEPDRQAGSAIGDLGIKHTDAKRVLMGMVTRSGKGGGGDGTVVYYVVQEGEVKPRQNG
jgi:tRNA-splicing endonuclease subunit Sen15, fungi type